MRASLTTQRLRLHHFTMDDAEELHGLFADPLTHTIGSGPFTDPSQTEQWIRNRTRAQQEHGLCWYALRDADTGTLIGNCGMLTGRTGHAEPELGYLIGKSHRGRGYAAEAASAVLAECHSAGLHRVWASIRPANAASRRIAEALGMHVDHAERDERGELLFYVIDLRAR
ncbi:N-acetyltransferase [Paractinoplanes deccanensis]|uniref:N-acetyltransferase n=1 Tax=Paractinoplanes deccanensis TaxID=113561 RepID=A0ABQ3Y723_9ACTN|nr:GNAT family N-acetyltransferase [Actinoplanes deccanensis]GID75770.1 N-acetyltransferase [Actinoplanes deccanensis]